MKKTLAFCALMGCALLARASGMEALENFVKNVKTGRAEFTQVVTQPSREGQAPKTKTSGGTFEFARPNHFRFAYRKPFEQVIVADGTTLWLHDVDLKQVTSRKQAQVLAQTPAAVIAAAPNLDALRKDFTLENAPDKDGLQWVVATPKSKEGQVHQVRVGFKGNELAALDITDSFGQRSVLTFTRAEQNVTLPADTFRFTPPPGAEVTRQGA